MLKRLFFLMILAGFVAAAAVGCSDTKVPKVDSASPATSNQLKPMKAGAGGPSPGNSNQ
jgi:hypothetical protein